MPISEYYGGHGEEVMAKMVAKYGKKQANRVFYATANSMKNQLNAMKSKKMFKKAKP